MSSESPENSEHAAHPAADLPPPSAGTSPNYALSICFLLTALNVMDRQVLAITASSIQTEFGLSDTDLGILTGFAFAIMHAVVGIPIASLADRANRRNLIAAGLVAWSALTAATGLARSYTQVFTARIGVGIGEAVGSGPVQSLLADYFPLHRRATALAVTGAGGNTGSFLALLIGGYLVEAWGWRSTFFIFGAPGVLVAALLFFTVDEPPRGRTDGATSGVQPLPLREGLSHFLGMPSFWYLTSSAAFNSFTNYGFIFFLPIAMERLYGLEPSEVGTTLAFAQALPTFFGVLASGFLADALGKRNLAWSLRLPALASAIAAPLGIAFLSADSLSAALPLCAAMSFFGTMWLATGNTALSAVIPPSVRATAYSVLVLFVSLIGLGLGPAFVGIASGHFEAEYGQGSIRYALMATACVQWIGALAHLLASRRYVRDVEFARARAQQAATA
ncbi:MAG: spinster family MFS transporter [Myxococcota bacterium]